MVSNELLQMQKTAAQIVVLFCLYKGTEADS